MCSSDLLTMRMSDEPGKQARGNEARPAAQNQQRFMRPPERPQQGALGGALAEAMKRAQQQQSPRR